MKLKALWCNPEGLWWYVNSKPKILLGHNSLCHLASRNEYLILKTLPTHSREVCLPYTRLMPGKPPPGPYQRCDFSYQQVSIALSKTQLAIMKLYGNLPRRSKAQYNRKNPVSPALPVVSFCCPAFPSAMRRFYNQPTCTCFFLKN